MAGTGATVTKLRGPGIIGGLGAEMIFEVLLDTSMEATGEPIDLTSYFKYIYSADCQAVEATADAAYQFTVVIPDSATAVTSTNIVIMAHQSNNTAQAFDVANAVDLSGVGELRLIVVGAPAITTSWA